MSCESALISRFALGLSGSSLPSLHSTRRVELSHSAQRGRGRRWRRVGRCTDVPLRGRDEPGGELDSVDGSLIGDLDVGALLLRSVIV
eukprot:scaffold92027_cov26-Tisochrysis_lutea.AAC.5